MQYFNNANNNDTHMMAKKLTQLIFSGEQIQLLLNYNEIELSRLLGQSGIQFHKNIEINKFKKVLIFLANYHKLLNLYGIKNQNYFTNDMALHFIILLGYSRVRKNQLQQSKNILKNAWNYSEAGKCSNTLISVALSNLCFLYIKKKKYYKALNCTFKVIEVMGRQLHQLKQLKNRNQLIQDSVILINSFIQCKKVLRKIIRYNKNSFYIHLYKYINQIGYKCSRKYLGRDSQFTKVFDTVDQIEKLPIYFQPEQERSNLEQKILKQLQGIYEVLKTKKQPEVIYVQKVVQKNQQPKVQPPPVIQQKLPQIQPQPPKPQPQKPDFIWPQDQTTASPSFFSNIKGWKVQGRILRSSQDSQKMLKYSLSQFIFGNVIFKYTKSGKSMTSILNADKIKQILSMIDIYCCIPYEFNLKKLTDLEFFTIYIYRFLCIDQGGNLQFTIKKKNTFKPFPFTFLKEKCLIFLHHVRGNSFRLSISPLNSPVSIHLNSEIKLNGLVKIYQNLPDFIYQKYNKVKQFYYKKQIQIPQLKKSQNQLHENQIVFLDEVKLVKKLQKVVKQFETFLVQQQQQEGGQDELLLEEYLGSYQNQFQHIYYGYIQNKSNQKQGKFIYAKYLDIGSVQICIRNTFKSYTLDSQSKAKGSTTIYGQKFQNDFGISLKVFQIQQTVRMILEVLLKKFDVKTFFSPLRTIDQDFYNQNAILELPFICKSHKRSIIDDENGYKVPVTISHISINNQIPLGFKIQAYYPVQGCLDYIFIKIHLSYWEKPVQTEKVIKKSQKKQNQPQQENHQLPDYAFKKNYFLIDWCQIQGYQWILKNLTIQNMKIKFRGINLNFFSLQRILQSYP